MSVRYRPANGEAHSAGNWRLGIVGIRDDFEAGDLEIDSLGWLLHGLGSGGLRQVVVVEVLLDFITDRISIHNGAFCGAEQSVRERCQGGCGGSVRLHLRAPCTEQTPKDHERQPSNRSARRASQAAKDRYKG